MSDCATPNQLEGFVRDRLAGWELEIVAAHVEECSLCQQALERITRVPEITRRSRTALDDALGAARVLELLKAKGPRVCNLRTTGDGDRPGSGDVDSGDAAALATRSSPSGASLSYPAIDGFRIIREVGRGGMGVVYEVEETRLSRRVALKVLRASLFPDPKQVQRFEREAAAAARLHHTNIVPVFGSGCQDGHHYYIMQYIEGRGIDAFLRELRREPSSLPPSECLSHLTDGDKLAYRALARIGLEVANALDHAHREGVLHRDIKPSNLLLDVKGHVWVADFGLAKTLDAGDLTSTGDVLGTLRYMAPERFAGQCDARSDLYSLGLTLYEAAVLRPAYEAPDCIALIERMRRDAPVSLRKLDARMPRDLETIINTLIASEPARRYASAAALAGDLRRFLEDRPIRARPASPPERALRWCRRNPWVAAFLLALSLGAIASTWQTFRATAAERLARLAESASRDERYRAERSRDRALGAVRTLLETGSYESHADEARPDRELVITASLAEAQALAREIEGDPGAQYQRIDAYTALARAQLDAGQAATALTSAYTAIRLAEELVARQPSDMKYRGSLAGALSKLSSLGMTDECQAAARRSNEICRQLAAESVKEQRAAWLTLMAINHYNIGQSDFGKREFTQALKSFEAAASACEQLITLGWHISDIRYLAAMNQLLLCSIYAREKQPDRALAAGNQAVAISESLVADHPERIEFGQRLNLAYEQMATRYIERKQPAEAIKCMERSRETLMQMAAKHGGAVGRMARIQALLAQADQTLCGIYDSDPVRYAERRRSVGSEAFEIVDKLSLVQPLVGHLRIIYGTQCIDRAEYQEDDGELPDLRALKKGERLWDSIIREAPADRQARAWLVVIRRTLADLLAARGEDGEASEWRLQSLTPARDDGNLFYEIAAVYAKRAGLVGRLPTRLTPLQLETRRERLVNHALALLREAAAAGFGDAAKLREDPAFASIAANHEFQTLAADVEFLVKASAQP